jgi:hypothetical protein
MSQVFSTLKPQPVDTLRVLEAKILASLTGGTSGGGSIGPVSSGNGTPTAATPGNLYVQWDSTPPGIIWWKDQNGNWN